MSRRQLLYTEEQLQKENEREVHGLGTSAEDSIQLYNTHKGQNDIHMQVHIAKFNNVPKKQSSILELIVIVINLIEYWSHFIFFKLKNMIKMYNGFRIRYNVYT